MTRRPYTQMQSLLDATQPKGRRYYWKSHYLPRLDPQAIDLVVEHAGRIRSPHSAILLFQIQGALGELPADHSPAGNRDAAYVLNIAGVVGERRRRRREHRLGARLLRGDAPLLDRRHLRQLPQRGRGPRSHRGGVRHGQPDRLAALKRSTTRTTCSGTRRTCKPRKLQVVPCDGMSLTVELSMDRSHGQFCTVARGAEIVCERWTPLVIRELLCGSKRFNDLRRGVPRMSTSLLAKRLQMLAEAGVVRRTPVGEGWEYTLTEAGEELRPIVMALGHWDQVDRVAVAR